MGVNLKESSVLKIVQWVAKQKPIILMGLIIFTASFLVFLNFYSSNCSILELLLYGIFFCASSFLISHTVFALYKKKKQQQLNPYYGEPPKEVKKILKLFSDTDILSQQEILSMAKLSLPKFQYLIDQLHGREFIEMFIFGIDPRSNSYCLRENGRVYMAKKKILK